MGLRVGFIGLGNQGKPIAAHLAPAGFETLLYDIDPAPVDELTAEGARAAASPREVGAGSDVVCICVPNDEHVRQVVLGEEGVLAGAAPGSAIAVHSTVLPSTIEALAEACAEKGVAVLDACVTGGAARAEQKQLTYIVGGEADALEKVRPVLEVSSVKVIHAGPLGSGAKLKLCLNLITYTQWAAAYESVHLAKAVGLPVEILEEAGESNGQITPLMRNYIQGLKMPDAARRSEPVQALMRGHTSVAEKDLAWVLTLAREAGITLPVSGLVSQLMARLYGVEDPKKR